MRTEFPTKNNQENANMQRYNLYVNEQKKRCKNSMSRKSTV